MYLCLEYFVRYANTFTSWITFIVIIRKLVCSRFELEIRLLVCEVLHILFKEPLYLALCLGCQQSDYFAGMCILFTIVEEILNAQHLFSVHPYQYPALLQLLSPVTDSTDIDRENSIRT